MSIIRVFEPLSLTADGQPVREFTIYDTQTVDFQAQGGSVTIGYDYYVDDVLQAEAVSSGLWTFTPPQWAHTWWTSRTTWRTPLRQRCTWSRRPVRTWRYPRPR